MSKNPTGYPSIDKPWLKYYKKDSIRAGLPKCTIYEYVWNNNKDYLSNVALNYFDRKITYQDLFDNIDKSAKGFSALGLKQGDIIIMVTVTIPETIYSLYALNKLGAIPNMVDPRTNIEGIKNYIQEVKAKVVVCLDVVYPKVIEAVKGTSVESIIIVSPSHSLPTVKKTLYRLFKAPKTTYSDICILWDDFIENGMGHSSQEAEYQENSCCVIVHTGGTTGTPKGVMLSNENLNASVVQCDKSGFVFKKDHKWLGVLPPFIAYGLGNGLHLPLAIGMTLILVPSFNPDEYDKLLLKYKPNHIAGAPSHYNSITKSKRLRNTDLSFIHSPIVGGDGTEIEFEKEINNFLLSHNCQSTLIKGYGMTEVCAAVSATACKDFNKLGSVGIPFTHSVISVFDPESGQELSYNQTGEICMLSPNTMLSYYDNQKATNEILRQHDDGKTWVHSGDLGYIDEDGCVFIEGRIKRMIIRYDGFKVFPPVIEKVIMHNQYVKAVCVVGVPDTIKSHGKLPLAYIVAEDSIDRTIIKNELIELCKNELPEYAQPLDYRFIDSLPLTTIGKVDYLSLEKEAENL